ncbi:MAG: hypothetical protein HZA93_19295 [Verrucomicrobia bacterium]|nr:hypothetical protein [Verrucomicrobiota bacterium]
MRELEPIMVQQARYLVALLQPWAKDPRAAALPPTPNRPASGEHGIRPSAHTAKGLALLARLAPDAAFSGALTRATARERALAIVRFLVRTHGAGGEVCADGKPWRNQWQSAYWASLAGEACWLLWDDLTPAERGLAARMIGDEADRFVGVTPPANLRDDSKAEENAWNSAVVSLAFNMFPRHPRHAAWRETAVRWIASSFATTSDLTRTDLVDGRPRRDWLSGANLLEDFTLENHRRVHPDYMACTYLLTSQAPMYAWGGHRVPEATHLNVEAINRVVQRLATPDGSVIYPNGQDWGLHRNIDWFEYHATAAVLYQDRASAALMRHSLAAVKRMAARDPAGAVYLPTETKLSSDQAMVLEYLAHIYALMAQLGEGPAPQPDAELWAALAGRQVFAEGKFGVMRSSESIATFSWGAQVMGLVVPLREDLLLAPEARGLVGYVAIDRVKTETPVMKRVDVTAPAGGLGVAGLLERGGGAVEQRFAFLALPDGRTVYADTVRLTGERRPALLDLGTLGVLNDRAWVFHDGRRTVTHEGGRVEFAAARAETDASAAWRSRWFNLDGLGIVRLAASGEARYVPRPTGAAGRLEQRFHLNAHAPEALADLAPGAAAAHSVLVFRPGDSAGRTRAAAERTKLRSRPGAALVQLTLDDGTEIELDLDALTIRVRVAP